jgi:hypothetical protein
MKEKPRIRLWILGVGLALLLLVFGTIFVILLAGLNIKISASPKKNSHAKIILFDSKKARGDIFLPDNPQGPVSDFSGTWKVHNNRYGRYLGVFPIPALEGILKIQQVGQKISGSLKLYDPNSNIPLSKWKVEEISGNSVAPNYIQFEGPPAPKPPLRWMIYIGKLETAKSGSRVINGQVKLHQEETSAKSVKYKVVDDGVIGDWEAVKVLDDKAE